MKLALVHNAYLHSGGEDTAFASEAALLTAAGHEVAVYRTSNSSLVSLPPSRQALATVWNQPERTLLAAFLRDLRPQVVHFHNTFPWLSPAAYYAARDAGAAVVQTLHNYRLICLAATLTRDAAPCQQCVGAAVPWPAIRHGCYRGRMASAAVTAMLAVHRLLGTWRRAVHAYVALTPAARDLFIAGGLPAGRLFIKPNFVAGDEPGSGLGGYALFAGRVSAEKDLDTVLRAWRGLSITIPLLIAGDGPERQTLRQRHADLENVTWLGWLSREETQRLMGGAAFLVMPSLCVEGVPLAALESLASGTPLLVSSTCGFGEPLVSQRAAVPFPPRDDQALAAAVSSLLADPRRLADMRVAARRAYEAAFTPQRNYEALMHIYRRAIEIRAEAQRTSDVRTSVPVAVRR